MREDSFLHTYQKDIREFQTLSGMERHQGNCLFTQLRIINIGNQCYISQEVFQRRLFAVTLAFNCEFLGYDVPQAKPVKRVLYDALFPGGCFYMPYPTESWDAGTFSPRPRWEIVPVFPEEIEVYKGGILVAHKGNKIT